MKQDHGIITLLTDFGLKDVYVAVMKGVINQINPKINIIDLTHGIPHQNIAAGRFNLLNAYPYFPEKTVHIAVVDPGVGTQRRAIAIQFNNNYLVGPDNGLLTGILEPFLTSEMAGINHNNLMAVELNYPEYWLTNKPTKTFQGRDIFAAVGAHLASGVPLEQLGTIIDPKTLVRLSLPPCQVHDLKIQGCIQYIDGFGNLVTNIPGGMVTNKNWYVAISKAKNKKSKKLPKKNQKKFKKNLNSPQQIPSGSSYLIGAGQTYGDVPPGQFVALVGFPMVG
ncbi:MAG: SAM-dependent chlorinase/fluorinase [Planktothrix sp. GU0601_MAG3]|nr:MAG: SAM-dependent chlorinase/fluorinase [Planktothrix sp. GU0601_MAG3]